MYAADGDDWQLRLAVDRFEQVLPAGPGASRDQVTTSAPVSLDEASGIPRHRHSDRPLIIPLMARIAFQVDSARASHEAARISKDSRERDGLRGDVVPVGPPSRESPGSATGDWR